MLFVPSGSENSELKNDVCYVGVGRKKNIVVWGIKYLGLVLKSIKSAVITSILIILLVGNIFGLTIIQKNSIGSFGQANGKFRKPVGLNGIKNSILVVDSQNRRIQRFTLNGTFEYSFQVIKDENDEVIEMETPYSVAIDPRGIVYVSDIDAAVILLRT